MPIRANLLNVTYTAESFSASVECVFPIENVLMEFWRCILLKKITFRAATNLLVKFPAVYNTVVAALFCRGNC